MKCKYTRYFLFSRVNPSASDYDLLLKVAKDCDVNIGYKTVVDGRKRRLSGYFILRGPRTYTWDVCRLLPNFQVVRMLSSIAFDFDFVKYDVVVNNHPYQSLRKQLF